MNIFKGTILFLSIFILVQCSKKGDTQTDNKKSDIKNEGMAVGLRSDIFEKKNYAVLDEKIKEQEFLKLSNKEISAIEAILKKKKRLNPNNNYNLAIIIHTKKNNYSDKMKKDYLAMLKKEEPDQGYGEKEFVADLPMGIFGNCAGNGFSQGSPNVQIKKDGTLAGYIETNATLEDYSGKWKIANGLLILDFKVKVDETGDTGGSGKTKTYKYRNQKTVIIDNTKIYGFNGQRCTLYSKEMGMYLMESPEGKKYLLKNKRKKGVITTKSGLQYQVLNKGTGPKPNDTDVVKVHYKGTLINGSEFDSSYKRNKPIEFPLRKVISGWTEGLQLMNTGSKFRLTIPCDLGYGSISRPGIPGRSVLIFEVELLEIIK